MGPAQKNSSPPNENTARGRKRKRVNKEVDTEAEGEKQNRALEGHGCSQDTNEKETEDSPQPGVDLETFKKLCREKMKLASTRPKLFLTLEDLREGKLRGDAGDAEAAQEKPLLFMFDLQNLLLYALQGQKSSFKPVWCRLLRVTKVPAVVVVVLDGVSYRDVEEHKDCCPYLWENFPTRVEMVAPAQYGSKAVEELFHVPLSASQLLKQSASKKVIDSMKERKSQIFSEGMHHLSSLSPTFSRLNLLLSKDQMVYEKYPVPTNVHQCANVEHFVYSKKKYAPVQASSPMFAVDCEMCMTSIQKMELTRISIVDEDLNVIYDTLVKPINRITNYLTQYSGITEKMMRSVTTRLRDVQNVIKKTLPPDAILCGQSLNSDLNALQMFHPYVIDSSVIFNLSGERRRKTGLKALSHFFLGKTIQAGSQGHSSVEDACATMELVLLKLSKGLEFGDMCVQATPAQPASGGSPSKADAMKGETTATDALTQKALLLQEWRKSHSQSIFPLIESCGKKVCVIDRPEVLSKVPVSDGVACLSVSSDQEAATLARRQLGHADLLWLGFPEVAGHFLQESTEREAVLRSLDKRLRKVVERSPEMALVAVLLTGRSSDGGRTENAGAFLKVNCQELPRVPRPPELPQKSDLQAGSSL